MLPAFRVSRANMEIGKPQKSSIGIEVRAGCSGSLDTKQSFFSYLGILLYFEHIFETDGPQACFGHEWLHLHADLHLLEE